MDDTRRKTMAAFRETNLSMRIAADYHVGEQSWFEWSAVAREAGLDRAVADSLPTLVTAAASSLPSHLQTDVVARFVERTSIRAAQVAAAIAR